MKIVPNNLFVKLLHTFLKFAILAGKPHNNNETLLLPAAKDMHVFNDGCSEDRITKEVIWMDQATWGTVTPDREEFQ